MMLGRTVDGRNSDRREREVRRGARYIFEEATSQEPLRAAGPAVLPVRVALCSETRASQAAIVIKYSKLQLFFLLLCRGHFVENIYIFIYIYSRFL